MKPNEKLNKDIWIVDYPDFITKPINSKEAIENAERILSITKSKYSPHPIINGKVYINGEPYSLEYPFKK